MMYEDIVKARNILSSVSSTDKDKRLDEKRDKVATELMLNIEGDTNEKYCEDFKAGFEEGVLYVIQNAIENNLDNDTISKISNCPLSKIESFKEMLW
ncbi:MAG: hypothetical protein K5986_08235 [Clostridium sp.]|nr:hypothetical protein [Clostridium sp.]